MSENDAAEAADVLVAPRHEVCGEWTLERMDWRTAHMVRMSFEVIRKTSTV